MFSGAVCRITGEHKSSTWTEIDGERVPTFPEFATPQGSVMVSERIYLEEITDEDMERLLNYEEKLRLSGEGLYSGRLSEEEIKIQKEQYDAKNS